MGKTLALIPAAGRGSRMLALTENSPKSMVPVAGKPLISHLLDQLIEREITDIAIIVGYKKEVLIDYVNQFYKDLNPYKELNITFIEQKELLGLGHAVYTALNEIDTTKYDHLFIMLGDAIFADYEIPLYSFISKPEESYIVCAEVDDFSRWCIAVKDESDDRLTGFLDKPTIEPEYKLAVLGAYYFNDMSRFKQACDTAIQSGITIKGEYQISTIILDYIKSIKVKVKTISLYDWYDFGELDTYNENRRKFNSSRHFNKVVYLTDGTIYKESKKNNSKIQREIMWYLALPRVYKQLAASMTKYELDDYNSHYETVYAPGLSLQEMWLYNNLTAENWNAIIRNVVKHIKSFGNYRFDFAAFDEDKLSLCKFIASQLETRHADEIIKNASPIVSINGKSIDEDKLSSFLYSYLRSIKPSVPGFLHGDMVFSNILYDFTSAKITLIDPRGDFNGFINTGDIRYDVAKLAQCIIGDYDYIVNDLFTLQYNDGGDVEYSLYNDKDKALKNQLLDKVVKELRLKKKDILYITAIQFLTMIPLHAENEKHQQMMYIKFIELLNEAEECND